MPWSGRKDDADRLTLVAAATMAVLLCLFLASQFYRAMPVQGATGRELIDSDQLVYPEFFIELTNGAATHGDWVSNPAPYFLSYYPIVGLTVLADGDWRLSLAVFSVAMAMALALALALVVRMASGLSPVRSILAALVTVAALALLMRHGDAWFGSLGGRHRQLNMVMFLLAACAMAKIAASPKTAHPLLYAYPAVCFLFGVSDALFMFHVAMPVALVACAWWLMSRGSAKKRAVLASAVAGCAFVYAGSVAWHHVNPFIANQFDDTWQRQLGNLYEGMKHAFLWQGPGAAFSLAASSVHAAAANAYSELFHGVNWPTNLMLAGTALALAPWLAYEPHNVNLAGDRRDGHLTPALPVLAQLVLALFVSLFLLFALVRFVDEYAWPLLWLPFLSLAVVWARLSCYDGHNKAGKAARICALPLTVAMAGALALDLAFFRPSGFVSDRVGCHQQIVAGKGLQRGLAPYWHGRQVKVPTGQQDHHLLYLAEPGIPIGLYGHVGNVRQLRGRAGYIVTEAGKPWAMAQFKNMYGLPAIITACASERYLLYKSNHLDSAEIQDVWPDIEWQPFLPDPAEPGDLAKYVATYAIW